MTATILNLQRKPSSGEDDEILTLEEAAIFLKLKRRTLYDMVQRRKIPFLRAGKFIRFSKQALLTWMKAEAES
ncbi:MAG: helix-turn-helix domain-containing protein [Acidobacteria bacterium]|nr:helix-turn-helix domain-containing protein [Acidobacteriota bacterium]